MTTRAKRRKISKGDDKKNEKEIEQQRFKENLVSLFTRKEYSRFSTSTSKILGSDWISKNNTARVKRIDEMEKHNEDYRYWMKTPRSLLSSMIKFLHYNKLKKFYEEFFPEDIRRKKLSKTMTVKEILDRYFNEMGDIEKRLAEVKNVEDMLEYNQSTQEFQFLNLCDVTVPVDVIIMIIGFIGYKKKTLFNVGSVCQMLYITILSSWPHILINGKENVFNQSILVLRSVRSITLRASPYTFYSYDSFLNSDFEFLFSHLNPSRLRSITLRNFKMKDYIKFLRFICRSKKCKPSTQNVTSLTYCNSTLRYNFSVTKEDTKSFVPPWKGVILKNAFPNLKEVHSIYNFHILEGLELEKLFINLILPRQFTSSQKCIGTVERDKGLHKGSIRDLSIVLRVSDSISIQNLPKFLKDFHSVSRFSIQVVSGGGSNPKVKLDITQILLPLESTLQELSLCDKVSRPYSRWDNNDFGDYPFLFTRTSSNLGFNSFLPNLTKLKVNFQMQLKIEHLMVCLDSANLKELSVVSRFTPEDYQVFSVSLFSRFRERLFEYEKLDMKIFCESLFLQFQSKRLSPRVGKIDKPTFSVELGHVLGKGWGMNIEGDYRLSNEQKHFLDLGDNQFVKDFVDTFPSICSQHPHRVIKLKDVSFKMYRFIEHVEKVRDQFQNPAIIGSDSEKYISRRYKRNEIEKMVSFYEVFNKGMEEESYKCELKESHEENEMEEHSFNCFHTGEEKKYFRYKGNFRKLFREYWYSKM